MQQTADFRLPTALGSDQNNPRAATIAWLKTALLLGLGAYFTYNIISGNLTNYINERFSWLSYVAAIIFALLGVHSAYSLLRRDSRSHQQISWLTLFVVAVPLILGTLVPSQPLGVEAISGGVATTGAVGVTTAADFTVPPEQRNVLDWLRTFNNATDYSQLNGQPADVIGFVYTEPTFSEGQFMVARFTVSCCVADASAIGLPVAYADSANLPQGEWVRVRGTMQVGEFRGDTMPILNAESIEVVEQPRHPYLYP